MGGGGMVTVELVSGGGGPPYAGAGGPGLQAPTPIALASAAPNNIAALSRATGPRGAAVVAPPRATGASQNGQLVSEAFT